MMSMSGSCCESVARWCVPLSSYASPSMVRIFIRRQIFAKLTGLSATCATRVQLLGMYVLSNSNTINEYVLHMKI